MSVDQSPVYAVKAVPLEKIVANDYNPNIVAPPEMKLLELSIWEDGFTMPCVCYYDNETDRYILVDGYHRYSVLRSSKRIYQRENGLLPVVVIDKELSNRMASTIRHNRARGSHNIELMCHIVAELPERVYVSFDIDGLSVEYCPHTGTPVAGGLTFNQAVYLLHETVRSGRRIIGFDVVEVVPRPGSSIDASTGARILYKLCGLTLKSEL